MRLTRQRERPTTENALAALRRAFQVQGAVVKALVLRDMRTRFGRTHLGYLLVIAWPLSHLGFILLGFLVAHRVAPVGNSSVLFYTTGALPYILFFYPARLMSFAIFLAKPLLYFPVVKIFDVMIARIYLEVISSISVLFFLIIVLILCGVSINPLRPEVAVLGVALTIYLGVGFGTFNMVFACIFRPWLLVSLLIMIGLYAISGAFAVPTIFSMEVRYYMSFNPLYQCVALLRGSFYDGFLDNTVSPGYVCGWATGLFLAGILSERLFRGKVLEP